MKVNSNNTDPVTGTDHQLFRISDFDDLVFEHRNKEYGAYDLRKRYNRALLAGTIVASMVVILSVIIPFISRPSTERVLTGGDGFYQVRMENLQPPEEIIYIPPSSPPPVAAKMQETVEYIPPVVVDSVNPMEQTMVTTDEVLASAEGDIIDASGSGFGDDLLPVGEGTGSDEPLFIVETMPTFKGGGLSEFRTWVFRRTRYPEEAIINKIGGTVFLTFIVEKDGSVS